MNEQDELDIIQSIRCLQRELWLNAEQHGFHQVQRVDDCPWIQATIKLALITSEIGEAIEALRKGDDDNFAEELADIFIRLLDMAEECNIDLGTAVIRKHAINKDRASLHDKKF
jgi:NTP pyrophosphatase (non-canonical NTP hydrolase)